MVLTGAISCATTTNHSHHHQEQESDPLSQYSLKNNAVTEQGERGNFIFTLYANESPIPLTKIHTWTVHIETADGKPLENAEVFVFGGMPMHRHDFPTVPKVKKYLGNGNYLVEGIKFNMIGHWEMRFSATQNHVKDRAVFKIHM